MDDKNVKKKIKQIITYGKASGYITYAKLNEMLPEEVISAQDLENFILMLAQSGVEVVNSEEEYKQIKELRDRVGEREDLLKRLESTEVRPSAIMVEIRKIIPSSVVLEWAKADFLAKTFDIGGVVAVSGGSAEGILTKFMQDIEKSKYFREAQLASLQDAQGGTTARFEINCQFE